MAKSLRSSRVWPSCFDTRQVSSQALRACQCVLFGVGLRALARKRGTRTPARCGPRRSCLAGRRASQKLMEARPPPCKPRPPLRPLVAGGLVPRCGPRQAHSADWPWGADCPVSPSLRCWCLPGLMPGAPRMPVRAVWCGARRKRRSSQRVRLHVVARTARPSYALRARGRSGRAPSLATVRPQSRWRSWLAGGLNIRLHCFYLPRLQAPGACNTVRPGAGALKTTNLMLRAPARLRSSAPQLF